MRCRRGNGSCAARKGSALLGNLGNFCGKSCVDRLQTSGAEGGLCAGREDDLAATCSEVCLGTGIEVRNESTRSGAITELTSFEMRMSRH